MQDSFSSPAPKIDIRKLKRAAGVHSSFVEIGHGDTPAFRILGKLPLADQLYLGLDIRADKWERRTMSYDISSGRKEIDMHRKDGNPCYRSVLSGDGALPLPDGSVDTVFMHMITNDSMIGWDIVLRLIEETARVLRKGGELAAFNAPRRWRMAERGDLVVDFRGGGFGMAADHWDREKTREIPELNANFTPLSQGEHLDFLSRYKTAAEGYAPGKTFSVFSRI